MVASPMVMVDVLLPLAWAPATVWMPPPPAPLPWRSRQRLLVSMMTVGAGNAPWNREVGRDGGRRDRGRILHVGAPPEPPVDDALTVPSPPEGWRSQNAAVPSAAGGCS
jgi:hypothetical protein